MSTADRAGRILSLYEAILASAARMREHASMLDMVSFHREADFRERLIQDLAAAWAEAPTSSGGVSEDPDPGLAAAARAATVRILEVDAETARAMGKSRDGLISGMKQLGLQRECMSSYRASAVRAGGAARFVDRVK